jgi:aminopeptidase YwaD
MVAKKYTEYMYGLIKKVDEKIGPREPCSPQEKALNQMMAEEWKPMCNQVDVEPFTCAPTAFLGFLPYAVICYIIAAVFYWVFPPAAAFFGLVGFSMLFFEFMRYKEFIDFLWPKKDSQNVAGVIKPKGPVKRRVIVCGHPDSAYEFNIWYFLKNLAVPVMIIGVVGVLILTGGSIAKTVAYFSGTAGAPVYKWIGIAAIAFYPFVGQFMLFHSYNPTRGSHDNMSALAVASGVGKYLADAKKDGSFFPENTEVVLLSAGCEEAGLRGSRRYVKKHLRELKELPTHAIALDGIGDDKHMTVVSLELCTAARHDPKIVKMAIESAGEHGFHIEKHLVPFGATDASSFSNAGISSTCILCQDITRLAPNYHTRLDTPENVSPIALEMTLQVIIDMIQKIDKTA